MYLAFMGPYEQGGPWSPGGISGVYRFLNRIWNYVNRYDADVKPNPEVGRILNKFINDIGGDIQKMSFNTGVSGLMKLLNEIESHEISKEEYETLLKLLSPFAPHLTEELWSRLTSPGKATSQSRIRDSRSESGQISEGYKSIHLENWPEYDEKMLADDKIKLAIQVNGRVRDTVEVKRGLSENEARKMAMASENVKKHIVGDIKKVVYVKDRIINLVV